MFKMFMQGGLLSMSILTVLLVAVFFAAWKAPRWVKEIGSFALVFGLMTPLFSLYQLFSTLQQVALDRGVNVILIPIIYGMMIYLISLVVRIVQKPRL